MKPIIVVKRCDYKKKSHIHMGQTELGQMVRSTLNVGNLMLVANSTKTL